MRKNVLNIPIDDLSSTEILKQVSVFASAKTPCHIATVNPEFIMAARKDEKFKEILQKTDLNIPDGFGLKIAGISHTVTGTDLVELLAKKGYRMYLLGAKPGVAKKAGEYLQLVGATIVGVKSLPLAQLPQLSHNEILEIREKRPDILLVALGQIKQEKFISAHMRKLRIPVSIGIGGALDYYAGVVYRAPKFLRELGLEWLFRLIMQPSRIKRIFTAVVIFPIVYLFSNKN